MNIASRTMMAAAVFAAASLAFAQADNRSGTPRSDRTDPSQMTTPPAGAEPSMPNRGDSPDNRALDNRSNTVPDTYQDRRSTRDRGRSGGTPADPSQMTTPPAGASPSGTGRP